MYTAINNFKYGLDSRRSELSSLPGSLIEALDGHITQGGEFEKRKAFISYARPAGTFGFQPTSNGIYVFGTAATGSVTVVSPIVYQQILHPKTIAGLGAVSLSAIVSSTVHNNYPFVTALFSDGTKYCYYNGQIVADFTYGYVANYMTTNSLVASNMSSAVSASVDYTSVLNTGSNAHEVNAFSIPGNSYSITAAVASTANITVSTTQDVSYTSANVFATNVTNSVDGSVLTLGGQIYRFKTTMAQAFDVQIGETIALTLTNLFLAINATGVAGTNYFTGTTKNTVIYAQNLAIATTPTFQIIAFASNTPPGNTQDIVENSLTSIAYVDESPTVPKAVATQAVGQFSIRQVVGSTLASGTVLLTPTGAPPNGSTLVIGGVTYTFVTTPTSPRDILRDPSSAFGYTPGELLKMGTAAIINGQSTFTTPNGHVLTGGVAGTADANVIANTSNISQNTVNLVAIAQGTAGNTVTLSGTGGAHVSGATLTGGIDSAISAITIGSPTQGILSTGTIKTNGTNVSNGDTVTIGSITYTFVTAAPSSTWQVQIGANAFASLTNLLLAINGTGTQLLNYDIATVNPQVLAVATLNGSILQVNSRVGGTSQNTINLITTAGTLTLSGSTLLGGLDSVSLLPSTVYVDNNQTTANFALKVVNAINSYSLTSGYYSSVVGNVIYIYSTGTNTFSNNAVVSVTAVGTVCIGFCVWEFNAAVLRGTSTAVTGAVTKIQVDGVPINRYKHSLGATAANAGGGATGATTDVSVTGLCQDVVKDIVAFAGSTYTAIAIANVIYLSKLITTSNDAPLNVVLTMTSAVSDQLSASALSQDNLVAVSSPDYIGFVRYPAGTQIKNTIFSSVAFNVIGGPEVAATGAIARAFGLGKHQSYITAEYSPIICSCKASGGYPPYKYLWTFSGGDNGFVVSNETSPNVTFSRPDNAGANTATFICIVTDSLGNQINSNEVKVHQP